MVFSGFLMSHNLLCFNHAINNEGEHAYGSGQCSFKNQKPEADYSSSKKRTPSFQGAFRMFAEVACGVGRFVGAMMTPKCRLRSRKQPSRNILVPDSQIWFGCRHISIRERAIYPHRRKPQVNSQCFLAGRRARRLSIRSGLSPSEVAGDF